MQNCSRTSEYRQETGSYDVCCPSLIRTCDPANSVVVFVVRGGCCRFNTKIEEEEEEEERDKEIPHIDS